MPRKTIAQTFADLRSKKRIGFMPFVAAGYPDLPSSMALLKAMEDCGADVIEIGIPFSDPIADGPTVQAAFTYALAKKIKVREIFDALAKERPRLSIPLVAMVSYSIVFRYGLDRFIREARESGFDGLLIPDLPPPEGDAICAKVRAGGLDTVLMVAPTTSPERRKEIARQCSGFVYYLSVTGITGARAELPPELVDGVKQMKSLTDCPICVGFGISKPEHVASLQGVADGAIVASMIMNRMKPRLNDGPEVLAGIVRECCGELLSKVR